MGGCALSIHQRLCWRARCGSIAVASRTLLSTRLAPGCTLQVLWPHHKRHAAVTPNGQLLSIADVSSCIAEHCETALLQVPSVRAGHWATWRLRTFCCKADLQKARLCVLNRCLHLLSQVLTARCVCWTRTKGTLQWRTWRHTAPAVLVWRSALTAECWRLLPAPLRPQRYENMHNMAVDNMA